MTRRSLSLGWQEKLFYQHKNDKNVHVVLKLIFKKKNMSLILKW